MKELSQEACKQGELWGHAARDWAATQERDTVPLWSAALDAAQVGPGTRILDAGCGTGGASQLAAERGATVYAIDPSVNMITIARERMPRADFRIAELENLPFPNAEFDAAVSVNSLQFAANTRLAVHELSRVCKPGGRVVTAVFSDPAVCDVAHVFRAIVALFDKPPSGAGPFALSSPDVIRLLFESVIELRLDNIQEVSCTHNYPDLETAMKAQMSAGPTWRAVELLGEQRVRSAVQGALEQLRQPDGSVPLTNRFRVATGIRK